ncbi:endonuclease V [uncultured Acetatifactor sp.]|uniref:endonuclease V n=1 Tax=uncultured Acetatifactor sp. TaxID=1671927 RepID=UPI00261615B9|nr:endonuclease V [uncultured Acetatifactor sp.]
MKEGQIMHTAEKEYIKIQNKLQKKIEIQNNIDIHAIKRVAGIDLAYWNAENKEYAVCCIVVLENESKQVVESKHALGMIDVPYIPGCLAFRELPLILETIKKLDTLPDLFMFDGNGYLHPRHMGIATHASFYLNKPTIGVAKKYYKIEETDYIMPPNEKNAYTDIVIKGEVYGRVLRTQKNVRPVFISVGNFIDLHTATTIVCDYVNSESHIPMPTRLADMETHKIRRMQEPTDNLSKRSD